MRKFLYLAVLTIAAAAVTSCRVDFSPNAEWRDVPSVYCVIDPEEDTVFVRVQRCYLGEDNLYNYSTIADSVNYPEGAVTVRLLAWRDDQASGCRLTSARRLVDQWDLSYMLRTGKPDGAFAGGEQPVYYCVPGAERLRRDSACIFQLVVLSTATSDTLAQATTNLVGFRPLTPVWGGDSAESKILTSPSSMRGNHFAYVMGCAGVIKWNVLPRGRYYQPILTFYYRKLGDTLSITIPGTPIPDANHAVTLQSKSITQERFLSTIGNALRDNTDSLFNVNHVDISIAVCNEDLYAYISSQGASTSTGQELQGYSNIDGGLGIFGSRRTHIRYQVPCDSTGKPGYIPASLKDLHVGFYGDWGKSK